MTAKEYLEQIRDLDKLITTYQDEIDVIMAKLTSTTVKAKEVNVKSSKEDKTAETIEKLILLKEKVNNYIDQYADMKEFATKVVNCIEPLQTRIVIIKYYFQAKTLEQVAVDIDRTYQWVCELRDRGIKEFEKNAKKFSPLDSN